MLFLVDCVLQAHVRRELLFGGKEVIFAVDDLVDVQVVIFLLRLLHGVFLGLALLQCLLESFFGLGKQAQIALKTGGVGRNVVTCRLAVLHLRFDGAHGLIHLAVGLLLTEKNSDFIEDFLLLVHLADGGAQGSTQAVKLLLHGRPLLIQALHLLSCIGQRLELTTSIGCGVPVVDERLLLLIVLLLALSRFLVKKGLFIDKFLLVVSFLVEPVGHFLGAVVLLLRFTHFCLESSDFIGDFCLCRLVQECDVLQQVFQPVALILLFLTGLINLFADFGIDIGAGHLLEQVGFLVIVAVQELGKFALSEHDCAEELLHVQPDSLLDKLFNLFDFAVVAVLGRTLVGHDHAYGLLDSAIHLVA